MKEKMKEKAYEITGKNVENMIKEYEGYNTKINLVFKNVSIVDGEVIVAVLDKISKCPFELIFNKENKKLEMYYY